jgi:hypothetical protein
MKKHLRKQLLWQQIEQLVKVNQFQKIGNLELSKDLCFCFLIQCQELKSFPEQFAFALARTYKWLIDKNISISMFIIEKYERFF